jgi:hypothetical protein
LYRTLCNGKVYISTKTTLIEIIIFVVLGKSTSNHTKLKEKLNVSNLSSGVYIIKINEKKHQRPENVSDNFKIHHKLNCNWDFFLNLVQMNQSKNQVYPIVVCL